MKKTILISSLAAGFALVGCNKSTKTSTASNDTTRDSTVVAAPATTASSTDTLANRVDSAADRTAADMRVAANKAGSAIDSAVTSASIGAHNLEWKLSADDLRDDVAANRKIVRTKSGAPTGASIDKSTLKSSVEGRIRADSELANVPIKVDADKDGTINLDGKANTIDQIGRAISLALDTDGVTRVTSKIDLDKQGNAHR